MHEIQAAAFRFDSDVLSRGERVVIRLAVKELHRQQILWPRTLLKI